MDQTLEGVYVTPGPDHYYPDENFTRMHPPQLSIRPKCYVSPKKDYIPGPNAYLLPSSFDNSLNGTVGIRFGIRTDDVVKSCAPSPNRYHIKSVNQATHPTLGARTMYPTIPEYDLKHQMDVPGPATYQRTAYRSDSPQFSLHQKTGGFEQKPQSPGPIYKVRCQFDREYPKVRSRQPGFSFGSRTVDPADRARMQGTGIGPGSYRIPTSIKGAKGY